MDYLLYLAQQSMHDTREVKLVDLKSSGFRLVKVDRDPYKSYELKTQKYQKL